MNRTPLHRNIPLRRVAMSPRRTPLRRSTQRLRLRRPAPPDERAAERLARDLVAIRSAGRCEVCTVDHAGTDWHHRVRKSQGGLWSAPNGLWVCRPLHAWITLNPRGARLKGWGLESHEDPAAERVLYRGFWVLLTDHGSVDPTTPPPPDFPIGGARHA